MRAFIDRFTKEHDFPPDATEDLLSAFDAICQDDSARDDFFAVLEQYNESLNCNYSAMLKDTVALANGVEVCEYTASLLLYVCLAKRLSEYYAERGIPQSIYFDSVHDLCYKLIECRLVKGVNGSFVAPWFAGFFNMTRFCLGRLQFEITKTDEGVTIDGIFYPKGTKSLAVHIPRTGTRLAYNEVLDSYSLADRFFKNEFSRDPILFCCHSWMLDPWLGEALKPSSNILTFAKDFLTVKTNISTVNNVVWRIFDEEFKGDPYALPQDSTIRRAYVQRIARGEDLIEALGFFIYKDGSIINI